MRQSTCRKKSLIELILKCRGETRIKGGDSKYLSVECHSTPDNGIDLAVMNRPTKLVRFPTIWPEIQVQIPLPIWIFPPAPVHVNQLPIFGSASHSHATTETSTHAGHQRGYKTGYRTYSAFIAGAFKISGRQSLSSCAKDDEAWKEASDNFCVTRSSQKENNFL